MREVNHVYSRTLAEWLFALVANMENFERLARLLGHDAEYPLTSSGTVAEVARWLDNAKFEIRDPFALRVAVRDVLKAQDDKTGLIDLADSIEKLREAFEPFKGSL